MVITDNRLTSDVQYEKLNSGDVFIFDTFVYMKTSMVSDNGNTYCVNLKTGEVNYMYDHEYVEKISAKVVIE